MNDVNESGTHKKEGRPENALPPMPPQLPPPAKDIPRWVFGVLSILLLILVIAFGRAYYRRNVLPNKLYQSASEHFEKEQYEEALKEYEMARSLRPTKEPPKSDDVIYRKAFSYERLGKLDEAVDAYEDHLVENPYDMRAVEKLGRAYLRLGRSYDALPYLERTLEVKSGDAEIFLALGKMYDEKGDTEKAVANYIDFINSDTKDAEELLEVGRALMKPARYRDALAAFDRASDFMASGDMRAYHAVNAAKNMLGWPTDAAMVITPGVSIGNMKLGLTRDEALEAWGGPLGRIDEDGYSVWGYNGTVETPETSVFFDSDGVIEIVTTSNKHSTSDGLSLANFREPKYADRFVKLRDEHSDPYIYRFTLKEGGLAFYSGDPISADRSRAAIYDGDHPLTEHMDAQWRYYWD